MAIINNNVQNVMFLRNAALYETREAALSALNENKGLGLDGTAILARYTAEEDSATVVKTIVGFVAVSGETKYLTVIDVEGSSADVEALRTEINNKLGDGVTSANTATAQLAALSGNTASTSAETSVEGAKRYADDLISTLDYTDTAVDGEYVSKVTQADGKIAVTRVELPSLSEVHEAGKPIIAVSEDKGQLAASAGTINAEFVNIADSGEKFTATTVEDALAEVKDAIGTAISGLDHSDTAIAKKFVTEVDEVDGVISVSRGEITSADKTVTLSDNQDGGVDFSVNVDGTTIIVDENTGTMSVASAALVQYEGDGKTIAISEVENAIRTVSSLLTLSSVTPSSTTVKEEYALKNANGETIGSTIKIYKDSHIVSITYITDSGDTHYQNLEYVYIDASGNTQTTYVDMSELVLEAEFASGVTVTNGIAHGVVDPTSENYLTVGADGFKLSGINDAIDAAVEDLDADVSGNSTHVTVNVVEEDGVITDVNVEEDNIANADDLATLSGKSVTELGSSNSSIEVATATTTADDGTVKYDVITDASKIKMTGFTAAESGFTAITTASTVTEAVKAIETEMIANEQTTSAALNDLRTDLNTVSGDVDTIKPIYLSGVSVNGSATTVSDHVAGFNVTAASGATTTNGTNAITVDTDANGNITLGISVLDCGTY